MKIINRLLSEQLKPLLFKGKALIITGARQVGKTTLLSEFLIQYDSTLWLNADEYVTRERLTNPTVNSLKNVVGSYKIVVIDEIQRVKNAGLLLKLFVDNFKNVQFFATGSSALGISDSIFEPLTGRFFLFHLYPFALAELYPSLSPFEVEKELPFHLVYGNYPEVCLKRDMSKTILKNLSQQYLYKDVLIWKNIRKPELLDKLLQLLAFQIGSEVSINELANQLKVKSETVVNYLDLLEKSFVIYRLRSFSLNPRKELSKKSKIFFWDNGIRNAVIDEFKDVMVRNDIGQLFENFIISERLKMNSWKSRNVKAFFWRNLNKSEVDYVETLLEKIAAFEIKWNTKKRHQVSKAFKNTYPKAKTGVITPENFTEFIF
jgi:predicted AAA+ superfamily ATPase